MLLYFFSWIMCMALLHMELACFQINESSSFELRNEFELHGHVKQAWKFRITVALSHEGTEGSLRHAKLWSIVLPNLNSQSGKSLSICIILYTWLTQVLIIFPFTWAGQDKDYLGSGVDEVFVGVELESSWIPSTCQFESVDSAGVNNIVIIPTVIFRAGKSVHWAFFIYSVGL